MEQNGMSVYKGQNCEDKVALDYFISRGQDMSKLTYLGIGENNGICLSNTYIFASMGCAGCAVEPSPKAFAKLKENYKYFPNVTLLNVAVGLVDATMPFYESGEHLGEGDVSLLSSLSLEETKRWEKEKFEKIDVLVVTFQTLLQMCPIKKLDYISIDAEGYDVHILRQIDFHALGTKLLIVEWNSQDYDIYWNIVKNFGFTLLHKNAENLLFCIP